jgi:hypothetical protein
MKTNLRIVGVPTNGHLPVEKRNSVCQTSSVGAPIDDKFLAANPRCQMFVRAAFPDEVPFGQPGEVWVVAFRRDSRGYIRLPAGTTSDAELTRGQIAAALLELGILKLRRGDKTIGETLEAAACVIVDTKDLVP